MHLLDGGSKQGMHSLAAAASHPLCLGAITITGHLWHLWLLHLGAQAKLYSNGIHASNV